MWNRFSWYFFKCILCNLSVYYCLQFCTVHRGIKGSKMVRRSVVTDGTGTGQGKGPYLSLLRNVTFQKINQLSYCGVFLIIILCVCFLLLGIYWLHWGHGAENIFECIMTVSCFYFEGKLTKIFTSVTSDYLFIFFSKTHVLKQWTCAVG